MHPDDPINYTVADRDLKYYIFDWDDNILHMPTMIHLEHRTASGEWEPCSVSTAMFAVIRSDSERYRPLHGDWEIACRDFRDVERNNENIFLRDTRIAIDCVVQGELAPAPSFQRFRQTLVQGRLFAIVTARGHDSRVIRRGVEYFIRTVLTARERSDMLANLRGYLAAFEPERRSAPDDDVLDYYLSLNRYHGVRSQDFKHRMQQEGIEAAQTEDAKRFAIKAFVEHIMAIARTRGLDRPISVGFSDDDPRTARAVEEFLRHELGPAFPGIKFVVYYTADPAHPHGRKVEVCGQLNLPLA